MYNRNNITNDTASDITMDIVDALAEDGLPVKEYQLQQFADPDALAQFIDSVEEPFRVSFPVKDHYVIITETGISVQ